jgi:hypothetical protein
VKYYLVKEIQTCYTEYVVRAETIAKAKSKAKVIDQDVAVLLNCPTFIKTNSYEAEMIKDTETGDPVVVRAIKDIELNYAPDEPEPPKKKRKKRKSKNDIDELVEMINGS